MHQYLHFVPCFGVDELESLVRDLRVDGGLPRREINLDYALDLLGKLQRVFTTFA